MRGIVIGLLLSSVAATAQAKLIEVSGPLSSAGVAASIIDAPDSVLDDTTKNTAMQGFDEALGVVTTVDHELDGGVWLPAGTVVDSHMIFLNSRSTSQINHFEVMWTFDGLILGVMSDRDGDLEAASSFELGAEGTDYTNRSQGTGPAAPFRARGLEGNNGGFGPHPNDGYVILGDTLRVGMSVTEPGDWIRVVTAPPGRIAVDVPAPASLALFGLGLIGLGAARRRVRN